MNSCPSPKPCLLTIGHSDYSLERFLSLLDQYKVTAIADVRSRPYSRFAPQFNRENLSGTLKAASVSYVFLGRELGARRAEKTAYRDGQAKYELVRQLPAYHDGLQRLRNGFAAQRVALMCAERDPLDCHRTILVCRSLRDEIAIAHILDDGSLETTEQAETRLLRLVGLPPKDLFRQRRELVEQAYDLQSERIAYVERDDTARPEEAVS